jgi:hypothetical protein
MFDMKNLTRLKKLDENAPDTMKAFRAFDKEAFVTLHSNPGITLVCFQSFSGI